MIRYEPIAANELSEIKESLPFFQPIDEQNFEDLIELAGIEGAETFMRLNKTSIVFLITNCNTDCEDSFVVYEFFKTSNGSYMKEPEPRIRATEFDLINKIIRQWKKRGETIA